MDSGRPSPPRQEEEPRDDACHPGLENRERRSRFEAAWRRHWSTLYRCSLRWTNGRQEDAEDALGQVAIVALQQLPNDLPPEDAHAWLLRLVYTKCMDLHRERKRSRNVLRETELPPAEIASDSPDLESMVLRGELGTMVRLYVSRLAPRLRAVAELHLLQDLQYAEIAEVLAISEENVRKRMQAVRALLREPLRRYLAGEAGAVPPLERQADRGRETAPARWSIEALRKYVRNHPRGWKKRWELASRLRREGLLEEAVAHFRGAALRQPRHSEFWIDLGDTLRAFGCRREAAAAYARALRWARDEATRRRAQHLLADCRD